MISRNAALVGVIALAVVDVVIPVPILGLILIWVIVARPPWALASIRSWYERV